MDIKEAMEILGSCEALGCGWYIQGQEEVEEAIEMALAALRAREAKRPLRRSGWPKDGRDTAEGFCPTCGSPLACITPRYYIKYPYFCRDCGQRIDWSDPDA